MKELFANEQYNVSGGLTISLPENRKFTLPETRVHLYDENGKHVGDKILGRP